jgi:hypothetical protein
LALSIIRHVIIVVHSDSAMCPCWLYLTCHPTV